MSVLDDLDYREQERIIKLVHSGVYTDERGRVADLLGCSTTLVDALYRQGILAIEESISDDPRTPEYVVTIDSKRWYEQDREAHLLMVGTTD